MQALYFFVGADGFEPPKSKDSRFTVCPIWPLWKTPIAQMRVQRYDYFPSYANFWAKILLNILFYLLFLSKDGRFSVLRRAIMARWARFACPTDAPVPRR